MSTITTTTTTTGRKTSSTAWCLWLLGCVGCCGVHRCYLDKWGTGILWYITGGLCGIGQCVDMCAMDSLVRDANRSSTHISVTTSSLPPAKQMQVAQPPPQPAYPPQSYSPPPAYDLSPSAPSY